MTIATLNGTPCLRVETRLARQGCWYADIWADQSKAVTGGATLSLAGGKLQLVGTAKRSDVYAETAVLRLVAGAGGMGTEIPPKWYRTTTARIVAQDILSAAGEQLSANSDAGLLGRQLTAHCQPRQTAASALSLLVEQIGPGAVWRAKPDGTIWIGKESWPAADDPGDLLFSDPRAQRSVYGTEVPTLLPGTAISGRYISQVEHMVSAEAVETAVHWETAPTDIDRATRAEKAIFDHFAARFDWLALRPAKVVKQNSDGPVSSDKQLGGTLEVQPESPDLPGLTQVPIRWGVPGALAKVASGARVMIAFENGDSGAPGAVAWDATTVAELALVAGKVLLGAGNAAQALALAQKTNDQFTALANAFSAWTPVAQDGGAALKTLLAALIAGPPAWPADVSSAVVTANG